MKIKVLIVNVLICNLTICQKPFCVGRLDSIFRIDKELYSLKANELIISEIDLGDKIFLLDNKYLYEKGNIQYLENLKLNFKSFFVKECALNYSPMFDTLFYAYAKDQIVRFKIRDAHKQKNIFIEDSINNERRKIDAQNKKYLDKITNIDEFLRSKSPTCLNAAGFYFILIQHSDFPTMEKNFTYLDSLSKAGFIERKTLALMIDRIRIEKKQPQIYGTQLYTDSHGEYKLSPIEDEINVDKRRTEVGLPPLRDYLKKFGVIYAAPDK